ncbi:MAG: DUF1571 domain-containing protein [Thermoguttaceae bacterium]|nr:DUF1571 domain-containing protein [Thermoguttaceae bacterium]
MTFHNLGKFAFHAFIGSAFLFGYVSPGVGEINETGAETGASAQDAPIQIALNDPAMSNAVLNSLEGEHPLLAPMRWADESAQYMQANVRDYTCTVTKRERINGILGKEEIMDAKVRHEPFSVYMKFTSPRRFSGREVIYVENANSGNLLAHGVGLEALAGTMHLSPTGRLAMKGNLHPITDFGVLNLARQLIRVGEVNIQKDSFDVNYFDAEIAGRACVCIEVLNQKRRDDVLFCKAHIYVDRELNIPIRYVSWGWGKNGDFPLLEEYTYSNIKLNVGLTDQDFDIRNPKYNYRESR